MERKKRQMMQIKSGLRRGTRLTWMIQRDAADPWMHLTGGLAHMDFTLDMVSRDIISIIVKILIGGVRGGTLDKSLRNPSLLILMEKKIN